MRKMFPIQFSHSQNSINRKYLFFLCSLTRDDKSRINQMKTTKEFAAFPFIIGVYKKLVIQWKKKSLPPMPIQFYAC